MLQEALLMMTEEFLQYIWQHHLFDKTVYQSHAGEQIEILSPGLRNFDEGPDFINTRIRIDNTTWVGNCEIHVCSSDWYKHQHQTNPLYDNVVLHVVYRHDQPVTNSKGQQIPTIELSFSDDLLENYNNYIARQTDIRCSDYLPKIEPVYISELLARTVVERLIQRTATIHQMLENSHYDWELCAFVLLGKAFGFKVNESPFEMLMRSIPLTVIQRTAHNLTAIEALLMGQAGLLNQNFNDEYPQQLSREYEFLRHKFNLTPIDEHLWKKMRIRPANFPTIRIAQLAAFIHKHPAFFQQLLHTSSIKQLHDLFDVTASKYWDNHYQFDRQAKNYPKKLSHQSIVLLAINTLVPLMFAYGHEKGKDIYKEQAIKLLEEMEPEQNSITAKWAKYGLTPRNASESQSLLQLYHKHCILQRCLQCDVFHQIMQKKLYAI